MGSVLLASKNKISPLCAAAALSLLHALTVFVDASRSNVYIVYMGEGLHHDPTVIINSHHDMLAAVLESKEAAADALLYSYEHGIRGFAATLTESQAKTIADFPGVVAVVPNQLYKIHTTRSWDFLGLASHSSKDLLSLSSMGDGIIIGIIDSGIWPESKSFSDEGIGPIPSRWNGVCVEGEHFNSTNCNRKLIGARWYTKGLLAELRKPVNFSQTDYLSPRDGMGHGTHTSATAAGSFVANASYNGLGLGTARGGAPQARLAIYKVCWNPEGGYCSSVDILKAFDDAIHDGVDVLSLSIGNRVPLFFEIDGHDGIAIGSFHAVAKGITVVCAAGNDGPQPQTVGNTAPWIITVAASTMDRTFPTLITLGNNRTIMGQGIFTGKEDIGFTGLVSPLGDGIDPIFASLCESLDIDNATIAGKVVLCYGDGGKVSDLKAAGIVGIIVAKNPMDLIYPCSDMPCIEIDYEMGAQILYYIRSSRSPMVKLSPSKTLVGKPLSTKVAFFSSRGPSSIAPAVLKPDIAAPGVNVLAAISSADPMAESGYAFDSGTSMACPHISAIVALLKSLHPLWSPAAIKSALVTTATIADESGGPIFAEGSPRKIADSFDYGGGIVNPNRAADPGLIYDMGMADYIHYLCSMGYNNRAITGLTGQPTDCSSHHHPSILDVNLPSITVPNLGTSLTLSRTVTNVGPVDSIYYATIEHPNGIQVSVSPHVLIFNSTTTILSFMVILSSTHKAMGGYYFGSLSWSDGKHVVRSPISVRAEFIPSYVDDG